MADPSALADSHVHLDRYPAAEVHGMLSRAADAGVAELLTVGTDLASSREAIALARRFPAVRAAVGVHPVRVAALANPSTALRALAGLARRAGVVAIGEVGLDAQTDELRSAIVRQEHFFTECLDLAASVGLPLVLHVVGAHDAALALLRPRAPVRAVVHYFAGDRVLAERYLEIGCFISVGRPITRPAQAALRTAVAAIPLDRLLLETDTYPLPGRATEPRDVVAVCAAIAEIRELAPSIVAAQTTENFRRLFGCS